MQRQPADYSLRSQTGFTLMETIVTLGLTVLLLSIFTLIITATTTLRRTQSRVQAMSFIQEELDTLRSLPFTELLNRTNGNFLGLSFTRGPWQVATHGSAPSGSNVLSLGTAQTAIVQETGLAILPGNYRNDFTFSTKINISASSPSGWGGGIAFRYRDAENHYRFRFTSGGIALDRVAQGTITTLWTQSATYSTATWYTLDVIAAQSAFTIKRNDVTLATVNDATFSGGDLALLTLNNALASFDNVSVTENAVTTVWNFDTDAIGALPTAWQRLSYLDLPAGTGSLTIANYLGQSTIKQTTTNISWSDNGVTKTVSGTTLISQ